MCLNYTQVGKYFVEFADTYDSIAYSTERCYQHHVTQDQGQDQDQLDRDQN